MSLTTTNKYGKISISDEAVAAVASQVASECYGVVEMVSRRFSDNFATLWGKTNWVKASRSQLSTTSSMSRFLSF